MSTDIPVHNPLRAKWLGYVYGPESGYPPELVRILDKGKFDCTRDTTNWGIGLSRKSQDQCCPICGTLAQNLLEEIIPQLRHMSMRPHEESIASWLEQRFPGISGEKLEKYVGEISEEVRNLKKLSGGYSSDGVAGLDGVIIKVDVPKRAREEYRNLRLDFKEASVYVPTPLSAPENLDDTTAIYTMSDITQGISGFDISGIRDPIKHYLDVAGWIHQRATEAVEREGIVLLVGPQKMDGMDYVTRIRTVAPRNQGIYRLIKVPVSAVSSLATPLDETNDLLRDVGDCVIHDNYKVGNLEDGKVFDLGHMRWGHESEDIMRFLLDPEIKKFAECEGTRFYVDPVFGLVPDIEYYTKGYISDRAKHDPVFQANTKKRNEIISIGSQAAFKEDVRYAASMSRRDLSDQSKLVKRNLFLYRANQRLHLLRN